MGLVINFCDKYIFLSILYIFIFCETAIIVLNLTIKHCENFWKEKICIWQILSHLTEIVYIYIFFADKRRTIAASNSRAHLLFWGAGGTNRSGSGERAVLFACKRHSASRPEAGEHPVCAPGPTMPGEGLRLRPGIGNSVPAECVQPLGDAATVDSSRQRRVHGPRGGGRLRGRGHFLWQALWSLVSGSHHVYSALRLSAFCR